MNETQAAEHMAQKLMRNRVKPGTKPYTQLTQTMLWLSTDGKMGKDCRSETAWLWELVK